MRRIFLDTNVLIDVILKRDDYVSAAKVMALFVDSRSKLITHNSKLITF